MNITSGFKVIMARYNISSNDIAKQLGISNRAINKAIGSGSIKKMEVIREYCAAIGCPVSELIQEAEKASPKPIERMKSVKLAIGQLSNITDNCVYHLKGEFGEVIYVGQTANLKSRLSSHVSKAEFFSFDYRTTKNNLDDEEMIDVMKFNPKLNLALKSTEMTPSVKTLKANIYLAIEAVDFNATIYRKSPTHANKTELLTKEKHDYIVSSVLDATMSAVESFDIMIKKEGLEKCTY